MNTKNSMYEHVGIVGKGALIIGFLSLTLLSNATASFSTVSDFVHYAQGVPSYPPSDSVDWHQPDFSSFHRSITPNWFDRMLDWLGIKKLYTFPIESFYQLLAEITQEREKIYPHGRLIQKMEPKSDSSYIIWGELNGAFHSLTRCLLELRKNGVIDNELKILDPNTFFIFNGDVVNTSAYILETLMVILLLLKRNPQQVIYIKGADEDKQRWMHGSFARGLKIRAIGITDEKVPFSSFLRRFFSTLPIALYLIAPDQKGKKREVVRISYDGVGSMELNEQEYAYFFDVYPENVVSILTKQDVIQPNITVKPKAIIHVEDRTKKYVPSDGLMLQTIAPITQWTVVSSPTASFRRLYGFFNDAFVRLQTANRLSAWTIQLYYQDVRRKNGFITGPVMNLVSGDAYQDKKQLEIDQLQEELTTIKEENQALLSECQKSASDTPVW